MLMCCCGSLPRCSEEEGAVEVEVQPPYPFNQSLPSSGDSEEEEGGAKEEEGGNGNIPASPWHPKPLGVSADHTQSQFREND